MPRTCRRLSTLSGSARTLTCVMLAAGLLLAAGSRAAAQSSESVQRSLTLHAVVASRTSLNVSAEVLQFVVVKSGQAATASVEFSASARTLAGNEVMLSVEAVAAAEWPEGPAGITRALRFAGYGDGTLAAEMRGTGPHVAGRWVGSGQRRGRLIFELRASQPGTYRIPVRFVLTMP